MESKEIVQRQSENTEMQDLAKRFEDELCNAVQSRFDNPGAKLRVLLEDPKLVYTSDITPDRINCFVIDDLQGYLYLVTAQIGEGDSTLSDYKVDVIS